LVPELAGSFSANGPTRHICHMQLRSTVVQVSPHREDAINAVMRCCYRHADARPGASVTPAWSICWLNGTGEVAVFVVGWSQIRADVRHRPGVGVTAVSLRGMMNA
jgi:hypothetical protein